MNETVQQARRQKVWARLIRNSGYVSLTLMVCFLSFSCRSVNPVSEQQHATYIGQFDVKNDLLITNFDGNPDVDDIHSIAAVATILADGRFSGVRHHAVAGAYGVQKKQRYIPANELFMAAFGDNWSDAHTDFDSALVVVTDLVVNRLRAGGNIWIAEAGQSDFSAAMIKAVNRVLPTVNTAERIHLVQHSNWNERHTSAESFEYVKSHSAYHKIPDGNIVGNGSPGFKTAEHIDWRSQLGNPRLINIWEMATDIANHYNGRDGRYLSKVVAGGGLDFSDVSEVCWIFGFDQIVDTREFFVTFGFEKIFNGKNWDGWYLKLRSGDTEMAKRVYSIEDEAVHIFNDTFPDEYTLNTGENATHGLFYTNKEYSKYILQFEYKWGTNIANNFDRWQYDAGVYYHVTDDKVWPIGIEYQIRYNHLTGRNHTGDLIRPRGDQYNWYFDPATDSYLHPKKGGELYEGRGWMHLSAETDNFHGLDDQWNKVEIIVMGNDYAIHKLNGEVVNMAFDLKPTAGIIGFQSETAEVYYRDFWIKEFDGVVPPETFLR